MSSSLKHNEVANWQSLRCRGIYHYNGIQNINRLFPNSFAAGMVFSLICRQSILKFGFIGVEDPVTAEGNITVSSLAQSLGRPNETVRRQISKIEAQGYIVRHGNNIEIDINGSKSQNIRVFIQKTYNDFLEYIELLIRADDMLPGNGVNFQADSIKRKILETALDIYIVPMATHVGTFKEWTYGNVWTGIAVDSIRHIEQSDCLSKTYRFINTPDEMRRAVSLRSVAKKMNLSYPTAWRAAQYLKEANLIVQSTDGWNVTSQNLQARSMPHADRTYFQYLGRQLRQLIVLGFDPKMAQSYKV